MPGPALTPEDRPPFPLVRERPRDESAPAEVGGIEVALPLPTQPQEGMAKSDPFACLPKAGQTLSPAGSPPSRPSQQLATVSSGVAPSGVAASTTRFDPSDARRRRLALGELQEIFITDDFLDAHQVARLLAAFPKVKGAIILLEPETILASELPEGFDPEAAAAAPSLIRAVRQFSQALCQSDAAAATILADLPISVFQEGKVCILIVHDGRGLLPGMKKRVADVAKALSAIYDTSSEHSPL